MSNNDLFNNEELQRKLLKLDDIVYAKFVPDCKTLVSGCKPNIATEIFLEDFEALLMKDFSLEEVQKEVFRVAKELGIPNMEQFDFSHAIKAAEIRHDFATALRNVKNGRELSKALGYGFTKNDIANLAKLHKANKFRKKIEDLLEDCNFHPECAVFSEGKYDKYLKEVAAC